MKHARTDYNRIQDPAGLIPDDEPVILIRGQDVTAPDVAHYWADRAAAAGADPAIVQAARDHAFRIAQWQSDNGSKVPDAPAEVLQ